MLRNGSQSTVNVRIGDVGRCTRVLAALCVVLISVSLAVCTFMAFFEYSSYDGISKEVMFWHKSLFGVQAGAWLMLSIVSSVIAWKLFKICLLVLGGYRAVCRTKRVTIFMVVSVALWGAPASYYFQIRARQNMMRCDVGGVQLIQAGFRFNYVVGWWLNFVVGTFVPIMLFSVVMASRPAAFLKRLTEGSGSHGQEALLGYVDEAQARLTTVRVGTNFEDEGTSWLSDSDAWTISTEEEHLRTQSEAPLQVTVPRTELRSNSSDAGSFIHKPANDH
jgi:hypothetical protein